MSQKFLALIDESVNEGYDRGIDLFMENLETDLAKHEVIAEAEGLDNIISAIMEDEDVDPTNEKAPIEEGKEEAKTEPETKVENKEEVVAENEIDETEKEVDALLAQLEKDGGTI